MKCERLKQHQVKLGEKLKQQVQSACVANELTDIRKWQNLSSNQIFWHYMHTQSHSVLTASFQGEPGLASCPLILHHLFLNCASFCNRPKLSISFLTQSHQVFFWRPLCLVRSISHVIQCLTQSISSVRSTYPNHLNLLIYRDQTTSLSTQSPPSHSEQDKLCSFRSFTAPQSESL